MGYQRILKKLGAAVLVLGLSVASVDAASLYVSAEKETQTDETQAEDTSGTETQATDASGTKTEVQQLTLTIKTYQKTYKTKKGRVYMEASYQYPQASGDSDAAKSFNRFYKKKYKAWKENSKKLAADAKAEVLTLPEDDARHYGDGVVCEIASQDENYISVLQLGYEYELGAHGMPYRVTDTFDAKTGKHVTATKLLNMTKTEINTKVRKLYLKKYKNTVGTDEFLFYDYAKLSLLKDDLNRIDFVGSGNYYVKKGKLRFYTYPYDIGPYAAGFIEVAIKL